MGALREGRKRWLLNSPPPLPPSQRPDRANGCMFPSRKKPECGRRTRLLLSSGTVAKNFISMPNNDACPSSPSRSPAPGTPPHLCSESSLLLRPFLPALSLGLSNKKREKEKEKREMGRGGGVEWCGLLKRPVVVSRRTGDGAFDSFFLYASSAVAATAAIKGSLNPNPCLAVAFASESVPSAVGIGSSCCLPGRHRATASRATHSAYKHSTRTTACGAKAAPRLPSPNTSSLPSPQARAYVPVHAP